MTNFHSAFNKFMLKDATRVFKKYPAFWNDKNVHLPLHNVAKLAAPQFPADAYDIVAMAAYYQSEARSKDPKRAFVVAARELVEDYGYNPDVSSALALWYFYLVLVPEHKITDEKDVYGMLLCYLNTGEIDLEHEW